MKHKVITRKILGSLLALVAVFSLSGCYEITMEANIDKQGIVSDASLNITLHQSTIDIYNSQNPNMKIEMDEDKFKEGIEGLASESEDSEKAKAFFDNCKYSKANETYTAICPFKPTKQINVIEFLDLDNPSYDVEGGKIYMSGTIPNTYGDMPSMMLNLFSYQAILHFASPIESIVGNGLYIDPNDDKTLTVDYVAGADSNVTIIISQYVDYLTLGIIIGSVILGLLIVIALIIIRNKRRDAIIPRYIR